MSSAPEMTHPNESCIECGTPKISGSCPQCKPIPSEAGFIYSPRQAAPESSFAAVPHPYARQSQPEFTEIPRPEKTGLRLAPHLNEKPKAKGGPPSWFSQRPPGTIAPPAITAKDSPNEEKASKPRPRPPAAPSRTVVHRDPAPKPPTPVVTKVAEKPVAPKPSEPKALAAQPEPFETNTPTAKAASTFISSLKGELSKKLRAAQALSEVMKRSDIRAHLKQLTPSERKQVQDLLSALCDVYATMSWIP